MLGAECVALTQYVDYSTWPQILDFCFQGSFITFYFTFIFELEKLWWINDFFLKVSYK